MLASGVEACCLNSVLLTLSCLGLLRVSHFVVLHRQATGLVGLIAVMALAALTLSWLILGVVDVQLPCFMLMHLCTSLLPSFFKGSPQAAPLAELYAAIAVARFLVHSSHAVHAVVYTDIELRANGFLSNQRDGDNADFWATLWQLISYVYFYYRHPLYQSP